MIKEKSVYDLVHSAVITEKATLLSESAGKYTFKVLKTATKTSVKKAIEKIFDVKVAKVNMINTKGKTRIFRGIEGRRPGFKKAIVTLQKDHKINIGGAVK